MDLEPKVAEKLGREIWDASTNWLNAGRRARWNDSLRAFQNLHPGGSKYLSGDYRYRSTLFRPKTRTMVRRGEMATAAAFFANEDVVSISAADDDDPKQQASAEILKALLQYRLTDTIPWFLTVVGARQDAEVMGICVAKCDWEYEERFLKTEDRPRIGANGMPVWDDKKKAAATDEYDLFEKIKDRPYIDLISPENIRFEPGCDWRNPVKSSPYLVELQPFYIQDAMLKMESNHGAPPEWQRVPISALRGATDVDDDVTRRARETGRVPGADHDAWKPKDYDIAWTRMNIVRYGNMDWCFRTLSGGGQILEPPRPIREVYLHGERPYVIGCVVLETHKTYPSSKVELTVDLQRAANQDWNTRFDNILLSLQPRQFVREGAAQDINDLSEFMPGRTVMINAAKGEPLSNIVSWDRPPPVDGAAFQEQDRINLDWDDLTGAFSNTSVQASQLTQQSATGMHLMSGEASGMNEYELRLFSETFVEPLMKLLIKVEQAYETDPVILAIAGKKAQLFQKFNISEITDELLNQSVTTRVNVGIGATNPQLKLRNFASGAQILGTIFGQSAAQGANFEEVSKEVFSLLGYKDGARFFQQGFDPAKAQLQQQLQKMQQKGGGDNGQSRVQTAQIQAQSRLQEAQIKAQTDQHLAQTDQQTAKFKEDQETQRQWLKMQADAAMTGLDHAHKTHTGNLDRSMQLPIATQGEPPPLPQPNASAGTMPFHQSSSMAPTSIPSSTGMPVIPAMSAAPDSTPQMPPHQAQPAGGVQPPSQPIQHTGEIEQLAAAVQQGNELLAGTLAGALHQGNQQIVSTLGEISHILASAMQSQQQPVEGAEKPDGLAHIAQSVQQGNQQLAHTLSQIGSLIVHAMQGSEATNQALIAALTRKKKVIRGADGRVEGVE